MADVSVDDIAQRAMALGLISSEQLKDVWASFGTQNVGTERFLQALRSSAGLTSYQTERLASGETTGFYYGKYKVLYSAGAGTFARVFRAVDSETNEIVAVKVLRQRYTSDPEAVNLFQREAELGMQLSHQNIVKVYSCDKYQGSYYMVMEFIEGQTLRKYLDTNKKIEYKIATRIVTDICTGLDYAFKRSHLHRDMKLTNVLVSSSGKSLLLDFGLAADTNNKKDQRNQRAVDYAVLERLTRVPRDDKRSDIYFLGVMFYQMLSGVAPIGETKDRSKRLDQTRFRTVKPIREVMPRIPVALAYIVDKAMSLDPEKRYQSPAAMLVDLKHAVKKLEELGSAEAASVREEPASVSSLSLVHDAKKKSEVRVVCIVESNPDFQDKFRNFFRKEGYRVLVISSIQRVLERLTSTDTKVDCVVFSAQTLGKNAVVGFNALTQNEVTKNIPALLILDENQVKWEAKAVRAKWRTTLIMPVRLPRVLTVINMLIEDRPAVKELPGFSASVSAKMTPHQSAIQLLAQTKKTKASKSTVTKKSSLADEVLENADLETSMPISSSKKRGDDEGGLSQEPDTDSYDDALDKKTDLIAAHLEEVMKEPADTGAVTPDFGKNSEFVPYPDDEEFFFDYICDRGL